MENANCTLIFLAYATVFFAIIAIICAFLIPELRRFFLIDDLHNNTLTRNCQFYKKLILRYFTAFLFVFGILYLSYYLVRCEKVFKEENVVIDSKKNKPDLTTTKDFGDQTEKVSKVKEKDNEAKREQFTTPRNKEKDMEQGDIVKSKVSHKAEAKNVEGDISSFKAVIFTPDEFKRKKFTCFQINGKSQMILADNSVPCQIKDKDIIKICFYDKDTTFLFNINSIKGN